MIKMINGLNITNGVRKKINMINVAWVKQINMLKKQ